MDDFVPDVTISVGAQVVSLDPTEDGSFKGRCLTRYSISPHLLPGAAMDPQHQFALLNALLAIKRLLDNDGIYAELEQLGVDASVQDVGDYDSAVEFTPAVA